MLTVATATSLGFTVKGDHGLAIVGLLYAFGFFLMTLFTKNIPEEKGDY